VVQTALVLRVSSAAEGQTTLDCTWLSEVSLLELNRAYGTVHEMAATRPRACYSRVSTQIERCFTRKRYANRPRVIDAGRCPRMITPCWCVSSRGTGRKLRLDGWPAAGKSGTTQLLIASFCLSATPAKSWRPVSGFGNERWQADEEGHPAAACR